MSRRRRSFGALPLLPALIGALLAAPASAQPAHPVTVNWDVLQFRGPYGQMEDVPEPSVTALLALGLGALSVTAWRRRRARRLGSHRASGGEVLAARDGPPDR